MAKTRKNPPKNSKGKHKKPKESKERLIVISTFILFIALLAYLFYYVETPSSNKDAVAVVNGNEITREQLDWWYKVSIIPEYREFVTKQDFLMLSLIPQEILMQKAKEENIKATRDDVEELLGVFIIDSGLTLDGFEDHLSSRGLTINDIKKSFETRATIIKLLEKENIGFIDEYAYQEYLNDLINNSKIEIFRENIDKLALRGFEETGDDLCNEGKPVVRLYTASWCKVCDDSGKIFENLVADERIEAFHWSLDTGDDLLTAERENGVPKEEIALFKKYSPDNLVPAVVIGCRYKRIGSFGIEEEDEFKAILKTLVGA